MKKNGRREKFMVIEKYTDGYQSNESDLPLFRTGRENQIKDMAKFVDEFDPKRHARKNDPVTSHKASEKAGGLAHQHCAEIKRVLDNVYPKGLNFEEIANRVGFTQTTQVSRRMVDLERQGLAVRTGETSPTSSGRQAQIWKATE